MKHKHRHGIEADWIKFYGIQNDQEKKIFLKGKQRSSLFSMHVIKRITEIKKKKSQIKQHSQNL